MNLLRPFTWIRRLLTTDLGRKRRTSRARAPDTSEASGMHADLRRLLGLDPRARQVMRHLGYIEHTLHRRGADALDGLPLDILAKALAQLQQLAPDRSSPGLAQLRARLAVLVAGKEAAARRFEPDNSQLSVFDSPQRLQVIEATPSDFEAVEKSWSRK
ncbi:MAG: hypothetical protein ACJ8G7_09735 [Rhizobacter sp.]